MSQITFYCCPDCSFEYASTYSKVKCPKCGSLNLERYLGDRRWIKADAADVSANARLVHSGDEPGKSRAAIARAICKSKNVDVVIPIKVNVCYTVSVNAINPAAIREALLKKDPSDWTVDPNFYEFLGSAFRDVVNKMTDEDLLDAVVSEHGKK